ncbi:hypothetical protein CVT26_000945 [Gymnopilus dilepis]|uniref:SGNH hydrolase-type esterase domain-containing protein n=1 Tax=Gymnopilus dilepis TaxID=231916 RepID=A0A409W7A0_9AGAR|nr:hypothetical protein CVT26_000945 [Gymnopilus dilepis]
MSTTRLPASSLPASARSGRWLEGPSGSLYASWSSASLSFLFTGSKLDLSIGEQTERKDRLNGGTRMIAVITGATEDEALRKPESWKALDPEPSSMVSIFDGTKLLEKKFVQITLIDWASTFELDALVTDDSASITSLIPHESEKKLELLLVGDSISSTLARPVEEGGEPVPYGILNGFPLVAQRLLREDPYNIRVDLELVAYPGYNLVHPTESESEQGIRNGMEEAFFWDSPWSKNRLAGPSKLVPKAVLIELGTNDQFFGYTKERFGAALVNLVKSLRSWYKNSIEHVWLIPPFPDSDMDGKELQLSRATPTFIDLLKSQIGDEVSVKLCDLVEGLTTENTVDGVHPPLAVHEDLGKKLAEFIYNNV